MIKCKNIWTVLACVLVLIMALAGCGAKPSEQAVATKDGKGGSILLGAIAETPSLDPFLEASDERTKRSVLMYEGLTWVNDRMQIEPKLAESWDVSNDGKTYTFHLRHNVYFHDGKQMTADDVKYSYDLFLNKKFGSGGAGDFAPVEEIKVVDNYTVQFILKEPYSTLLAVVGGRFGAVVPKGAYDNGDLRTKEDGTGPYKLISWDPKSKMVLQKFDKYWDKNVGNVDQLVIRIVPDENTLVAGLRSGQIDLAILGDPKDYNTLKNVSNLLVERHPALRWELLDFDNSTAPTNNVKVRQAIAKAIDKNEVMQAATGGIGTVIGTMPNSFGDWVVPGKDLPNQQRDIEGAKKLLAEAGYSNGFPLPLRIISSFSWMRPAAEVIASNLNDIGIKVNIETVDLGVWIKDWSGYKSPNTLNEWGGFTDPDILYYRHFHSKPKGGDWRRWNNKTADQLLDKGRTSTDKAVRKQVYDDIQKLLASDNPTIPLFSPDDVVVTQKNVVGYKHHPSGMWYGLLFAKKEAK